MPDANLADAGILVVHGIGDQARSTTVLSFGDPVARFLEAWLTARSGHVQAAGSEVDPSGAAEHALPHMRLTVTGPGPSAANFDLLLAEAWW
jgi:hypothetical protein